MYGREWNQDSCGMMYDVMISFLKGLSPNLFNAGGGKNALLANNINFKWLSSMGGGVCSKNSGLGC